MERLAVLGEERLVGVEGVCGLLGALDLLGEGGEERMVEGLVLLSVQGEVVEELGHVLCRLGELLVAELV